MSCSYPINVSKNVGVGGVGGLSVKYSLRIWWGFFFNILREGHFCLAVNQGLLPCYKTWCTITIVWSNWALSTSGLVTNHVHKIRISMNPGL